MNLFKINPYTHDYENRSIKWMADYLGFVGMGLSILAIVLFALDY